MEPGPDCEVVASFPEGGAAVVRHGRASYMAMLPEADVLTDFIERLCAEAGIATRRLPPTLRMRQRGGLTFAINYAAQAVEAPAPEGASFVLGGRTIGPRDVAAWTEGA